MEYRNLYEETMDEIHGRGYTVDRIAWICFVTDMEDDYVICKVPVERFLDAARNTEYDVDMGNTVNPTLCIVFDDGSYLEWEHDYDYMWQGWNYVSCVYEPRRTYPDDLELNLLELENDEEE